MCNDPNTLLLTILSSHFMVQVDWNRLLYGMPLMPADNNDVMETTLEIQDLLHRTVLKLSDRAQALASSGEFESALKDSAALRVLDPTFSKGYLLAAEIYSQQGHHQAVIDICNEGLGNIPSSDPAYATLGIMADKSKALLQIRVDFIVSLPMEIVIRIASMIFTKGHPADDPIRYSCLQVSKAWNKHLLVAYNAVELHLANCKTFEKWYSHVGRYGCYLKTLTTDGCIPPSYELLDRTKFASLRTLSIRGKCCQIVQNVVMASHLHHIRYHTG